MLARAARCRVVVRLFVPGECVMLTRIAVDCSGAEHIQRSILKQVSVDRGRAGVAVVGNRSFNRQQEQLRRVIEFNLLAREVGEDL